MLFGIFSGMAWLILIFYLLQILERNRDLMDALVDQLVQKKSITKQEFSNLVEEKGHLEPMPQSIVDIRTAKRIQFQEMMMARK